MSVWAAQDWEESTKNGYFDGKNPGAGMTREQTAIVINRLRRNLLRLIAGNVEITALNKRMQEIEKELEG